jgi:pimeloyl-ACP methyl ester carboxylesterase
MPEVPRTGRLRRDRAGRTSRRWVADKPLVPTTGYIDLDGHRLYYESYGEGERVLVYLHGLLLDASLNRGLARALAERGHRVVLLDLLGHGHSDKPTAASEHRMDRYALQVVALMDALSIESAVVGGVSLGANVSLLTAVRAPERVRGLVLEMPVLEWAAPVAALTFVPLLLVLRYGSGLARVLASVARRVPRTGIDPLNSVFEALSLQPEQAAAVLQGILVGPIAPTVEERAAITAPTLILAHRADLLHPLSDAADLAREMASARLLRASSPLELRLRPERLTGKLAEFLDKVWTDTGRGSRPLPLLARDRAVLPDLQSSGGTA